MERDSTRFLRLEEDPGPGPSIVLYSFDRPTITVGRLQDPARSLDLSAAHMLELPVVQRPTGGRAVLHASEWTYGAVVPCDHPLLGGDLRESCRALVGLLALALRDAYGLPVRLSGTAGPEPGEDGAAGPIGRADAELREACFVRSFGYEAVVGGRKLMGSAQRRGRRAILQQGSLLVGPGHERLARVLRTPRRRDETTSRAVESFLSVESAENALAKRAVTLTELLGGPPDPARFVEALTARWVRGGYASATGRKVDVNTPVTS